MERIAAAAAPQTSGGTTCAEAIGQTETERLVRIASAVLNETGYQMGANKIARLARRFQARVAGNGWSFFEFFANAIRLDVDRRRDLMNNPDFVRVIGYADPTGETAVAHVMRQRGM